MDNDLTFLEKERIRASFRREDRRDRVSEQECRDERRRRFQEAMEGVRQETRVKLEDDRHHNELESEKWRLEEKLPRELDLYFGDFQRREQFGLDLERQHNDEAVRKLEVELDLEFDDFVRRSLFSALLGRFISPALSRKEVDAIIWQEQANLKKIDNSSP